MRPSAVLDCIVILEDLGEHEHRLRLIEELEQADDPTVRMRGRVARSVFRVATEPAEAVEEAEAVAAEALTVFAAADDDLGAAYAYDLAAFTSWVRSRAVPALHALEALLLHAERAGSRLLAGRALMMLTGPLIYGPFETELIRARRGGGPDRHQRARRAPGDHRRPPNQRTSQPAGRYPARMRTSAGVTGSSTRPAPGVTAWAAMNSPVPSR
jgi:hypothetical protein